MKIFISWSGQRSHAAALILRDWLPNVLQSLRIYVSSEDIDKGARWLKDISGELEDTSFGILCVTKENLRAPWLNFEAGALSKSIDNSNVAPFLLDLKNSDVSGPIVQFQSTVFEKEDFRKLIHSINNALSDHRLERARLDETFDVWWPKIEERLQAIPEDSAQISQDKVESPDATKFLGILEEVLELTRQQSRLMSNQDRSVGVAFAPARFLGAERPYQRIDTHALLQLLDSWYRLVDKVAELPMSNESVERLNPVIRMGRKAAKHLNGRYGPVESALAAYDLGTTMSGNHRPFQVDDGRAEEE